MIPFVLAALSLAAFAIDLAGYELGRRRGVAFLDRLYRWSSEPDELRRRAETVLARHGARSLLVAKFVPGLTRIVPPLAGAFGIGRLRFLLYDLAGLLLWAGTWASAGSFLSLGHVPGLAGAIALIAFVLHSYVRLPRWGRHGTPTGVPAGWPTGGSASDDHRARRFLDAA